MKKFVPVFFTLAFLLSATASFAQEDAPDEAMEQEEVEASDLAIFATPKDMWEITPNVGIAFLGGDVDGNIGFGAGLSLRKSIDYLFSLRFDALWASFSGEMSDDWQDRNGFNRTYETSWFSGTAYGVITLNSSRFDRPVKKTNIYAMAGLGANFYEVTDYDNETNVNEDDLERQLSTHASVGAGIAFRLSRRVNLGVESKIFLLFGNRADLLDGINTVRGGFSPYRDLLSYSSLRLGINLGDFNKRSEPKYWTNPMEGVAAEVQQLREAQAALAIEDSDGDGVIDQFDEEPGSDPNALVDTRGRTLDSDNDDIPDHLDAEPYITLRPGESVDSEGRVIRDDRPQLTEERVLELIRENQVEPETEVFLPMVHFNLNSATIRYADYGTLSGIAQLMRQAPRQRVQVLGYTDQTGNADYNEILSYRRAKAVVDHLVEKHGISRDRLVLRYNGQNDQLVPSNQTYMNRRVEFSLVGADAEDMAPPAGYNE